jgi:26S proteasome regulatory subunit N1
VGEVPRIGLGVSLSWYVFSSSIFIALFTFCTGLQEGSDATLATLKAIEHPIARQAEVLVDMCSYAGTGNVLKVQTLLHHCDAHIEKKEKEKEEAKADGEDKKEDKPEEKEVDDTFQAFAVIGIALVAMGEEIGAEMSLRQFNHLVPFSGFRR